MIYPQRRSCPRCRAVFSHGVSHCPRDGSRLDSLPKDLIVGTTVAGRYRIESVLAEGGTGRVYRARDLSSGSSMVVVKILYGELAALAGYRQRFAREATVAARVAHPNVLSAIDVGETRSGLSFLVTPYFHGRRLSAVLDREAPMRLARAVAILRKICLGLDAIHSQGIIHRDLKGANILVGVGGAREEVKILDFGIAIDSTAASDDLLRPDRILGTASYLAPERITGSGVDHRCDLFSMGVLFYRMLAGVFPYEGSPLLRAVQGATCSPPPIKDRVPGLRVQPQAEAIAVRLLQSSPRRRHGSALEVIEDLDRLLSTDALR